MREIRLAEGHIHIAQQTSVDFHRMTAGISLGTPNLPVGEFSSMRSVAGPGAAAAGTRTESV
jgi:hypothetical protein